jgi:hypothetical protein
MRLPWSRGHSDVPPAPDPEDTVRKLAESKRDLEQTRAETDYYRGLGNALRAIRRENHLAETFLAAAHAHSQGGPQND